MKTVGERFGSAIAAGLGDIPLHIRAASGETRLSEWRNHCTLEPVLVGCLVGMDQIQHCWYIPPLIAD